LYAARLDEVRRDHACDIDGARDVIANKFVVSMSLVMSFVERSGGQLQ